MYSLLNGLFYLLDTVFHPFLKIFSCYKYLYYYYVQCCRDDIENQAAFAAHLDSVFSIYAGQGNVNCISLVERNGREKILSGT